MTNVERELPRLGVRPNPTAPFGIDLYLHDDGNAWTGWLRIAIADGLDMDDPRAGGVLTADGQRDLIELAPVGPEQAAT